MFATLVKHTVSLGNKASVSGSPPPVVIVIVDDPLDTAPLRAALNDRRELPSVIDAVVKSPELIFSGLTITYRLICENSNAINSIFAVDFRIM